MKTLIKSITIIFFLIIIFLSYLSIFGIETDRFNTQILNKIKNFDSNLEVELKKIRLVLDPFTLKLKVKTVGSKLKKQNKVIEIENIKSQISLKSIITNRFSIENIEVSTKSIEIKNLLSFIRTFENSPQLFILEKIIKKGYLIADINIDFDQDGKIKDNFKINGFIKDAGLSYLKKYNFQNLNLIFSYKKSELSVTDMKFSLDNLNFLSEKILTKNLGNKYLIEGNISHKNLDIDKKNVDLLIKPLLPKIDFEKLKFSSNNNFSFKINKKFKIEDFVLDSNLLIDEFLILNTLGLKNFFPNIRESFNFSDHELSIKYYKDSLSIDGKGNILIQEKDDYITYSLNEKNKILNFKTSLKINDNPLKIDSLNFNKEKALIELEGTKNKKKEINIKSFSINEKTD